MVAREISLDSVRTDGWLERIAEGIASYKTICEIVGERFFAFSIIVGARISAITVDRRNPDQTLIDFVTSAEGETADTQRLTLIDFRRRLVSALLVNDDFNVPAPQTDEPEALQLHLGVRYLLLAPLFGYRVEKLIVDTTGAGAAAQEESFVVLKREDGELASVTLAIFRERLRMLVRDELEQTSGQRGSIDLSKVAEAELAALDERWSDVVRILGGWPAPLSIYLRTPEGQSLGADARQLVTKGLGLLGTACMRMGEVEQAEEVFRVGVQYAVEGEAGAEIYRRLGEALLVAERAGEAIGPLRRAVTFGDAPYMILPLLGRALLARGQTVAAYGCFREALSQRPEQESGLQPNAESVAELERYLEVARAKLGDAIRPWERLMGLSA